jgi:type I site-specific restriction endonuclease
VVIKLSTNDSETKADTSTGDNNNDLASSRVVIPLVEKQSEVRIAYQANVESQKALLSAFKEQEQWAENAYKNTERRYRAYEDIIDKAFKNREIMDNAALDLYRKTVEAAGTVYRETLKHTLQICKQTTDQAWQSYIRAYEPTKPSPLNRLKSIVRSSGDRLTLSFKNTKTKLIVTYQRMRMRLLAKTSL